MNVYLIAVLVILISNYILGLIVEILNASCAHSSLPDEFRNSYDANRYKKSQNYLRENTYFKILRSTIMSFIILFLILGGGFNFIDQIARGFNLGYIFTGLIFAGIIFLGSQIIDIPFSAYHTFVIEEKYGFNRTTPKTFILDLLKSWLLISVIGSIVFSFIVWFFTKGAGAWLWCWLGVTCFEIFLIFVAPVLIMPLFNKFTPLREGELKEAIHSYADSQNFKMKGVFKIDGSRRSSKSNAFFTGFGKYRRIALFDTLIKRHTTSELISVLAHEMGHYKKGHILKYMAIEILTKGLMFFILSLFIKNPNLFTAFKMQEVSIYAGLFFFGFLYAPINMIFSIFANFLSRKHEHEADIYAITTYKKPEDFISALKKLTIDNLSNLTPHPLKVFFSYSHPPILERIEAIRKNRCF